MALALLYNLKKEEKRKKLKLLLFKYNIPSREVAAKDFSLSIGELSEGKEAEEPAEAPEVSFTDEMMVLCGLSPLQFNGLIDSMRTSRIPIALKAVMTEQNAAWNSVTLHEELSREHEAMRGLSIKNAAKKSAHKKK